MQQAGIYAITCVISGEQYVGSSKNLYSRWKQHLSVLRKNKSHCLVLQRAWNKYGEDAFIFSVLEYVNSIEDLIPREQYYLDTLQPAYNARTVADRNTGIQWTPEQIARMSAGHVGYQHTPESIEKIRTSNFGRVFSEEHRQHIREARSNPSPEARANSSASRKGKINRAVVEASANARRGKKRPPQVGAKISATTRLRREQGLYVELDQRRSESPQIRALSQSRCGKPLLQTTKDKLAAIPRVRDPKTGRFLKFHEEKI